MAASVTLAGGTGAVLALSDPSLASVAATFIREAAQSSTPAIDQYGDFVVDVIKSINGGVDEQKRADLLVLLRDVSVKARIPRPRK